jgi:hypothetical protein
MGVGGGGVSNGVVGHALRASKLWTKVLSAKPFVDPMARIETSPVKINAFPRSVAARRRLGAAGQAWGLQFLIVLHNDAHL